MPTPYGPTTTEKAASIRADIKAAQRAGELAAPAGVKFSVRTEYTSCMSAIDVTIKNAPAEWLDSFGRELREMTGELPGQLREIVRRHYQADGRHSFANIRLENGQTVLAA